MSFKDRVAKDTGLRPAGTKAQEAQKRRKMDERIKQALKREADENTDDIIRET